MSPRIPQGRDGLGLEIDRYHHYLLPVLSSLVFIPLHQLSHSFLYFSVAVVERCTFISANSTPFKLSDPSLSFLKYPGVSCFIER